MCIIIDTNCIPSVFDVESVNHEEFDPIHNWIIFGKGKVVYGGKKYFDEIDNKYLDIFLQLRKAGKAVYVRDKDVDNEAKAISKIIQHKDFDDQHLVALLRVSGCKLICSKDKRAFPFFTHNIFFTPRSNRPKIYTCKSNQNLLSDKNIADICKPCKKTTNAQRKILTI